MHDVSINVSRGAEDRHGNAVVDLDRMRCDNLGRRAGQGHVGIELDRAIAAPAIKRDQSVRCQSAVAKEQISVRSQCPYFDRVSAHGQRVAESNGAVGAGLLDVNRAVIRFHIA